MERLRHSKGFTVVELMMTMITLAIIAQIAITLFIDMKRRGHDTEALSDGRNLLTVANINFINLDDVDYAATDGQFIGTKFNDGTDRSKPIFRLSPGVKIEFLGAGLGLKDSSTGTPGDPDNRLEARIYHEQGTKLSGGSPKKYWILIDEDDGLMSEPK